MYVSMSVCVCIHIYIKYIYIYIYIYIGYVHHTLCNDLQPLQRPAARNTFRMCLLFEQILLILVHPTSSY